MLRKRCEVRRRKAALLSLHIILLTLSTGTKAVIQRSCYVEKTNLERKRDGEWYSLVPKLRQSSRKHFKYFRMSKELFDVLLEILGPKLVHKPTHACTISAGERLALTLQNDQHHMGGFEGKLRASAYQRDMGRKRRGFAELWQFPLCAGAIDGKHVIIKCPHNSDTEYYNYKKSFSIVLMAIVDAKYRFVAVDVGGFGRQSDGGTFQNCALGNAIKDGSIDLPPPAALPGADVHSPYVFVADAAFPLKPNIMCPYPGVNLANEQRIFNYRLSRARRIVANAFGILSARWRMFQKSMEYQPVVVDRITLACVALHNFRRSSQLISAGCPNYMPPKFADWFREDGTRISGKWRKLVQSDVSLFGLKKRVQRHQNSDVRNKLRDYFNSSAGSVSWQHQRALGIKKKQV